MLSTQTIPVLDLRDLRGDRRPIFITQLGTALEKIGFFALTNHGVDSTLIQSAYQVAQQFFDLPLDVKANYGNPDLNGQKGYTAFGTEHAKDHPFPDLKEFWHVKREVSFDDPSYPVNCAIAEVPDFQPVMSRLYAQLEACAIELLKACALYLGEPIDFFTDMILESKTLLRVLHYPPIPPDAHPASVRSAPHEDINLITLLCEATDDGLELLQRDGTWLPIRAVPGQIIVDSGDMLQNLTNGVMKSTTHRVVNPTNDRSRRFSMPFFVHPRSEVDLSPLPSCIAQVGSQRFPSITASDYLMQRLREIGLAK